MTTSPESKWTKGPWRVAPAKDYPDSLHIEVDTADRGQTGHICQVGMRDDPIAHADARLIASAPDLYEALNKAMPFIDDALDAVEVMSDSVLTKECREAVRLARAALSKAEGR